MKYSEQEIEEVNDLDIVEVARKLGIDMQEHKGVFMACCVDHTENTPSMQIGSRKEEYRHMTKCYSCGKKHNVIGLVMAHNNCGFKEAMEWATQFTDLTAPPTPQGGRQHFERAACLRSTVRGSASSPRGGREEGAIGREEGAAYGTMREVQQFVSLNNALSKCMRHYFPEDVVTRVTMDYLLGVDYERFHSDHTLFASIDSQDRVHNVKLQEYCTTPTSPLFCHSMKGRTKWVGIPGPPNPPRGEITAASRIEGGKQDGNEMAVGCNQPLPFGGDATTWQRGADTDCLFGEHLLKRYPEKIVALVESPKNAIVGAC